MLLTQAKSAAFALGRFGDDSLARGAKRATINDARRAGATAIDFRCKHVAVLCDEIANARNIGGGAENGGM